MTQKGNFSSSNQPSIFQVQTVSFREGKATKFRMDSDGFVFSHLKFFNKSLFLRQKLLVDVVFPQVLGNKQLHK